MLEVSLTEPMSEMEMRMLTDAQIDSALCGWPAVHVPTFDAICAQAKLANRYPHLPVEPPGCPTPGACSAVRFVAGAEKGLPSEPKNWTQAKQQAATEERIWNGSAVFIIMDYADSLKIHALSLAAQLADSAEVEEEYDKVKRVVERSGLEPAPASTMAIKPLHLRVQDLLAQLAEVRGGEQDHIAVVINNNQPGWTNIVETAPNITLDVGTKLFLGEQ